MRYSSQFLDDIRDRLPISQVIGARVSWDRRKTNAAKGDYWACCPFHGEKSPSFHCEDQKGRYYCFGCGVSGDHFGFLTELDGLAFPEAIERLADMAGLTLPVADPGAQDRDRERTSLARVMEMARDFFESQLQDARGAKARAYLRERGLSAATQQRFRIGYAPDSRNALKEYLAQKGVGKPEMEACGLLVFGPDVPVSYDRFRDRIMFPIEDMRGRVVAFGGRALAADAPAKYLNSPETALFSKGKLLFNARRAREAVREAGTVIAVEGYMDVIALDQAGLGHVVAPLGTALTEDQLALLWKMTEVPVLCFDGDEAGRRAAYRVVDLALPALQPGRSLHFAMMPEGVDPDDLVRSEGAAALHAHIRDALPLAEMLWTRETAGETFTAPERRAALEKKLRDATARIREESVRRHYGQAMRERAYSFFAPVRTARRAGDRQGNPYGSGSPFGSGPRATGARLSVSQALSQSAMVKKSHRTVPLREAALVTAIVNHPMLLVDCFEEISSLDLQSDEARQAINTILNIFSEAETLDRAGLRQSLGQAGLDPVLARFEAQTRGVNLWIALEEAAYEDARHGFVQALVLQHRAGALDRELRAAEIALAEEETEGDNGAANLERLNQIRAEALTEDMTEALIEGFGVSSGRPTRSF